MPYFAHQLLEDVTNTIGSAASDVTEKAVEITTTVSGVVTAGQHAANGTVYVSWWSSYPLLITFLIVLLTTAVLLFAAIVTMIILENKSHKMQINLLMSEISKVYEKNGNTNAAKSIETDLNKKK